MEQLIAFLEKLKRNPNVRSLDEAPTVQAVVLPILRYLGWDTDNVFDEVIPQFAVQGGKVDFCLRANSNDVFVEVKRPAEDLDAHQDQLLNYSYRQGVDLAVLTNGLSWSIYLPLKKGKWETRRCYTIDIVEQDSGEAASRFMELLSKPQVSSGQAVKNAEAIFESLLKKKTVEDTVPQAWNKITSEPEQALVNLLAEVTRKMCGVQPEIGQVKEFFNTFGGRFQLLPQDDLPEEPKPTKVAAPKRSISSSQPPIRRITQDDLIPHILRSILNHGGKAPKETVQKDIYQKFKDIFDQPWYQELVAYGVPRWQHNVAWARNRAKDRELIKPPAESGRGYWELTELGRKEAASHI